MKKTIKKAAILLITLSVIMSVATITSSAAASASVRVSNSTPTINTSITVTVVANGGGSPLYAADFVIKYDSSILQFVSGDSASGGAGAVRVTSAIEGQSSKSYTLTFNAIKTGSTSVLVDSSSSFVSFESDDVYVGASASVTVKDVSKSANNNLKSLSLSKGNLSPKFAQSRTSYTATVANSVTECRVYATAADSKATVSVSGSNKLIVGNNTREVTVTAESGAVKKYTIVITRLEKGADPPAETPADTSEEPANPYEVIVDDVRYTVATDISGINLPNGFTAAKADYNGVEVAVAEDKGKNFSIYYLKALDGSDYIPYILDGKEFKVLKTITFGTNTYIISDLPKGYTVSKDYYSTNVEINGQSIKCFAVNAPEMSDFYYIYCFFNDDFYGYRYDAKEGILQRCPEFKILKATDKEVVKKEENIIGRFNLLSTNGKIIVIGVIVAVLAIIALVVLIIIKVISNRRYFIEEDTAYLTFQSKFAEVDVTEDGQIESEESDLEAEEDEEI